MHNCSRTVIHNILVKKSLILMNGQVFFNKKKYIQKQQDNQLNLKRKKKGTLFLDSRSSIETQDFAQSNRMPKIGNSAQVST